MIWLARKLLVELQKPQELHRRIVQRQLKNEHDQEIPKERYIFLEERDTILDDLRLI